MNMHSSSVIKDDNRLPANIPANDSKDSPPIPRVVVIGNATLYLGDANDIVPLISQVDAVVADPPYGIDFANQHWDSEVPETGFWQKVSSVMKPGAHLLSFAAPRTYHLACTEIANANFEIRDQVIWMFGGAMATSHNMGKAIDRMLGAKREVIGRQNQVYAATKFHGQNRHKTSFDIKSDVPVTVEAAQWNEWGNGLKTAHEPIVMARKRVIGGSVAANVLRFGTGALNIGECRAAGGRHPANIITDGETDCFPNGEHRFFYCAKASKKERNINGLLNDHPTVKPLALMHHLVTLVTQPGGTVLDPFMGSGSTGVAAIQCGFKFIGIERDPAYFEIAVARLQDAHDACKDGEIVVQRRLLKKEVPMSLKDLLALADDSLAELFNRKAHDPAKARLAIIKGIDRTRNQFESPTPLKGRKWFRVKNDVVRFEPPFAIGSDRVHHIPSERFGEYLTKLRSVVESGDLDHVLSSKEPKATNPNRVKRSWSPEQFAKFKATRDANRANKGDDTVAAIKPARRAKKTA